MKRSKVTKAMAERVLLAVRQRFAAYLEHDPQGPTLYEPGYHTDGWVIAWQGGPEDWTALVGDYVSKVPQLSKYGIWTEAVNHWSIAIVRD